MRTIIDLPKEQLDLLKLLAQTEGVSRAEIVRRALTHLFQGLPALKSETAFGLWKKRKINSKKYQSKLRSEWK